MSRTFRIAFLVAIASALIIVAGFDLRLALATRDLAEPAIALDQHERHPNGMGVVIPVPALDEHERRALANEPSLYTNLDAHERLAKSRGIAASVPAALDEHERPAWIERQARTSGR